MTTGRINQVATVLRTASAVRLPVDGDTRALCTCIAKQAGTVPEAAREPFDTFAARMRSVDATTGAFIWR
jgi:hypothetical protein